MRCVLTATTTVVHTERGLVEGFIIVLIIIAFIVFFPSKN